MEATTAGGGGGGDLPPHSDNVDEELGRVRLALRAVFAQPSPTSAATADLHRAEQQWFQERQLADRYLTSFQSTAVSWMVCDRLLMEQGAASAGGGGGDTPAALLQQSRFFAAQTLHTKCRSEIHELPQSSLVSLRDSLLQHLQRYCAGTASSSTALTTRLALCVSALAIQMGWTTIVTDLIQKQQQSNGSAEATAVILPILRVLPEECASDRLLLVDEATRFQMRDHLVQSAPLVFNFFHSLASSTASSGARMLEAFHTWIRYVPVYPSALVESPLLQGAVQALMNPSSSASAVHDHDEMCLLEPATDVVVEVLRMYPSHQYGNESLVRLLIPLLSQLPLETAIKNPHTDDDVLRSYCRVVTEMGESYMSWILSKEYGQASQLVNWVLQCSSIEDTEIASITLHFWYRFVMELESMEPYDWRQELIDAYTPHLLNLIDVCVSSLMKYPSDTPDIPDDSIDELHRYRYYVSETVEDCCRLLGGSCVLQRLNGLFRKEVERVSNRAAQQPLSITEWQGIESSLACITAIHRFVPSDESELLPLCFQVIPQLPPTVRPLRSTASKTIGVFAYWLALHADWLQPLLPYLAQGLSIPETASAAAVAIKELCECSNQEFAIAEPVLQLYQEISTTADPGRRLDLADELQILEGVCRALSRHIQDTRSADGNAFVSRLVQPIGTRLAASVADPNAPAGRIIHEIERLTVIVQFLSFPTPSSSLGSNGRQHPIVELMSSSWSLLDAATNRFPSHNMLAEKICRLHKHALRAAGKQAYAPVLDALMQQLVQSFERTHQAPYLYAASICITEYGGDPAYTQRLSAMVEAMARTSFSFLHTLDELTNHPDVVEEFFYLMGRVVSYCPDPLMMSPLLLSLFQCAVVGMRLDHPGANGGTLKFLEATVSYGLSLREQQKPECQSALERALSQEGQAIVTNLAYALMGELPTSCNKNKYIPEILWKLNLLCPSLLAQWLASAFEPIGTALPERAKNDFMGALDVGLARDEFKLAARAFQSACERERRFHKVQRSA